MKFFSLAQLEFIERALPIEEILVIVSIRVFRHFMRPRSGRKRMFIKVRVL